MKTSADGFARGVAEGGSPPRGARGLLVTLLVVLLGGACTWYVARTFRWREVFPLLGGIRWGLFLVGGSLCTLLYWLFRTLRWRALLGALGVRVPFSRLYYASALFLSFSLVTPLQAGEVLKVEFLKRSGLLERLRGYGSFAVERLLDLGTLVLATLAGLALGAVPIPATAKDRLPVLLSLAGAGLILLAAAGMVLAARLLPRLREEARLWRTHAAALLRATAWTLLGWLAVAAAWGVTLASLGIHITPLQAPALMASVTLANLLSLVPGAVGVSEAGAAFVLERMGVPAVQAQAGALGIRLFSVLVILLGLTHLAAGNLLGRAARSDGPDPGTGGLPF